MLTVQAGGKIVTIKALKNDIVVAIMRFMPEFLNILNFLLSRV